MHDPGWAAGASSTVVLTQPSPQPWIQAFPFSSLDKSELTEDSSDDPSPASVAVGELAVGDALSLRAEVTDIFPKQEKGKLRHAPRK